MERREAGFLVACKDEEEVRQPVEVSQGFAVRQQLLAEHPGHVPFAPALNEIHARSLSRGYDIADQI